MYFFFLKNTLQVKLFKKSIGNQLFFSLFYVNICCLIQEQQILVFFNGLVLIFLGIYNEQSRSSMGRMFKSY